MARKWWTLTASAPQGEPGSITVSRGQLEDLLEEESVYLEVDVVMSAERGKVRFVSGNTECAAWHYPGINGACVIMAGGGAVTKEPGTDLFAKRFNDAGFAVLAFDYRRLGESGGPSLWDGPIAELSADRRCLAPTLPLGAHRHVMETTHRTVRLARRLTFRGAVLSNC